MIPGSENDVSRETLERLREFAALVAAWTKKINLISQNDQATIWDRHIVDSLQLSKVAINPGPTWLDIGSGGGFPGLVLAILHRESRPEARHMLMESDQRKATFLMTAAHKLDLDVTVHAERSENVAPQNADVVTARAFAPLSRLLDHVDRHMNPTGQCILPKGASVDAELAEAKANWTLDAARIQSQTNPGATILRLTKVSRA